jgi:oligopeptide/dipeptide ABC transporter ATP-binding protein
MTVFLSLAVFSGLALNLILQFALGLRGAARDEDPGLPFFQIGVLFLAVLLVWLVFALVAAPLGLGFLEYPALFPLSVLASTGLEQLFFRFSPPLRSARRLFKPLAAYDGLTPAAVFITLDTASSFFEAAALSLGFSLGVFLSLVLLREIRIRAALENVPPLLRGSPLIHISMGHLSLIFSSLAAVLFRAAGVFLRFSRVSPPRLRKLKSPGEGLNSRFFRPYFRAMPVISAHLLKKRFNLEAGFFARFGNFVHAVRDLSFSIGENEAYGLVGESGCGKTTTARLLVRMYEADGGGITYRDSTDVRALRGAALKSFREKVKYVFQDPARSLNPRMNIAEVLLSGYRQSSSWPGEKTARKEAAAILEEAGLQGADLERRPAEFSGGQRQRISIARGLLAKPELLICDEVVSALDVSIQGQILNLLLDIRSRRGLSFLFIAHDLKVACYFCDRIGVMYRGELMEEAPAEDLYEKGRHPYTGLLFSAVGGGSFPPRSSPPRPQAGLGGLPLPPSAGEPPRNAPLPPLPASCSFADRCPEAVERCFRERPEMRETEPGRRIRCFQV